MEKNKRFCSIISIYQLIKNSAIHILLLKFGIKITFSIFHQNILRMYVITYLIS